jgi:hypothetical protein
MKKRHTRRRFLKTTGSSAAALIVGPRASLVFAQETSATAESTPEERAQQVVAALGDTLIPSDPGDPGYRDLEGSHITEEVMKILALKPEQLETFDHAARSLTGTRFAQLGEEQRESFLYQVIEGKDFEDPALLQVCQGVYQLCRSTIFRLFYQNFPENVVPRDANDFPILQPGDEHQLTNPNTKELVTGWDIANYGGPMTWEEEEERRARFKKVHWHEDEGESCPLLE